MSWNPPHIRQHIQDTISLVHCICLKSQNDARNFFHTHYDYSCFSYLAFIDGFQPTLYEV